MQLNYTVFIHFVYKKYLYTIYTLFIQKKFIPKIFIQIYLYLNRSSSHVFKNSAHFLPQLIGRHNELPGFITYRCPILLCIEGLVIHGTFLHQCVSAQFPIRIFVKWVHYHSIHIKEQFSDIIEVQLGRFCELKKPFVIYLSFILKN